MIDIIAILTDQDDYKKAKSYRTTLKNRMMNEGSELVTICDQLKMMALDGKMNLTLKHQVEAEEWLGGLDYQNALATQ